MRCTTLAALSIAALGMLLPTESASAQESTTRGFTLGLHLGGASIAVENQDRFNAGGGGISVGYGINRRITILAQLDGGQFENAQFDDQTTGIVQGDWTMGHFDVGARLHFANSLRSWVPYLQATLGLRVVGVTRPTVNNTSVQEVRLSGGGLTLGGGLAYYLSQTLALDLQLLWTGGTFTTVSIDNVSRAGFDVQATSSRFNVGLTWWP